MITKLLSLPQVNKTKVLSWIEPSKENLLFWFQIAMAWITLVPLYLNILKGKTEGLTLVVYITMITFFFMGLTLAHSSYKEKRVKKRLQLVIVYAQLVILIGVSIVVWINRIPWVLGDTIVSIAVYALVISSIGLSHLYMDVKGSVKERLQDPMVRAFMAIWCKAVPQLWFAWTMIDQGGSGGMPLVSLIGVHFNGWPRFIHVVLSGKRDGWDRATKGLFIGEFANVSTFTIASIVWVIFRI